MVVFGAQWLFFRQNITMLGLIYGFILGQLVVLFYFICIHLATNFSFFERIDFRFVKLVVKKFKKFPMYDIPSSLFSILSSQVPVIFFASKFDNNIAGQYFLTQAILQAPITLISSSFLDTFKNKAYNEKLQSGNITKVFIQYLKLLFYIAILPSVVIFFFIEDLIVWAYGDNWELAGLFAQILIPSMFFRFIANPLSYTFYIYNQQKLNMLSMFILFLYMIFSFYYFSSVTNVVIAISIGYSILYLCYILYSAKLANCFQSINYEK
jgi:O-antigen/teichoic acid export membrane protein